MTFQYRCLKCKFGRLAKIFVWHKNRELCPELQFYCKKIGIWKNQIVYIPLELVQELDMKCCAQGKACGASNRQQHSRIIKQSWSCIFSLMVFLSSRNLQRTIKACMHFLSKHVRRLLRE